MNLPKLTLDIDSLHLYTFLAVLRTQTVVECQIGATQPYSTLTIDGNVPDGGVDVTSVATLKRWNTSLVDGTSVDILA